MSSNSGGPVFIIYDIILIYLISECGRAIFLNQRVNTSKVIRFCDLLSRVICMGWERIHECESSISFKKWV